MSSFLSEMKALFVIFLLSVVAAAIESTPRHLQDDDSFNYSANYTADFQYLTDPSCDGASPRLKISCTGPNLTLLSTSDDTIRCNEVLDEKTENRTTFQCRSTCNATACENVYRYQSYNDDYLNGPFGSIAFMCKGDSLAQVDAQFRYLKGGNSNGTCAASVDGSTRRFNYHVARMGVSCPSQNSGSAREYVYDDTYFDCMAAGAMTTDLSLDHAADDMFGCVSGMVCRTEECSFEFGEIMITTNVPNFFDTCVESSLSGPITAYPTSAPVFSTMLYSALFEASWAFLLEPVQSSCISVNNSPIMTVACGNGATIEFINATDEEINCQQFVDNELSCTVNEESIVNNFASVFYSCIGPQIPSSAVTYPQSEAVCENITESTLIRQAVTLGVYCENTTGWYIHDFFVECAEAEHQFSKTVQQYGVNRTRYTCSESASFATGSSRTDTQVIPNVTIATDDSWLAPGNRYKECRTTMPQSPVAPTSISPTTSVPMSSIQTSVPAASVPTAPAPWLVQMTNPPTVPIMTNTTVSPVASMPTIIPPIAAQRITTAPVQQSNDRSTSSPGAVIGSVVGALGGLVLLLAIGWWWVRRRRHDLASSLLVEKSSCLDSTATPPAVVTIPPTVVRGRELSYKDQSRSVDEDDSDFLLATPLRSVPLAVQMQDAPCRVEPSGVHLDQEKSAMHD